LKGLAFDVSEGIFKQDNGPLVENIYLIQQIITILRHLMKP